MVLAGFTMLRLEELMFVRFDRHIPGRMRLGAVGFNDSSRLKVQHIKKTVKYQLKLTRTLANICRVPQINHRNTEILDGFMNESVIVHVKL